MRVNEKLLKRWLRTLPDAHDHSRHEVLIIVNQAVHCPHSIPLGYSVPCVAVH
jgi:hypothetical protein